MDKIKAQRMKKDGNEGSVDKTKKCEKEKQDDKNKQDGENTKGTSEWRNKDNNNERITCKYFLISKCRFGAKCRNIHPEICKNWAK